MRCVPVSTSLMTMPPTSGLQVGSGVTELLAADAREQLKVTATGVKAFERQESKVHTSRTPFTV